MASKQLRVSAADLVQVMQAIATPLPHWSIGTVMSVVTHVLGDPPFPAPGRVSIQFDGEPEPGTALYPVLHGYTPHVGDRVLIAEVKHSRVVLGTMT